MSVLIDPPAWHAHGRQWSHLASDTSLEELHRLAQLLGIPRRAFEGDHYDVPADLYPRALAAGAQAVSTRELLLRLRASGLRRSKRRGEKVLSSSGAGPDRFDVVLSRILPPPHGQHRLVVLSGDGSAVRTVRTAAGPDLPHLPGPPAPTGAAVLGFRRTWLLSGGRRHLLHDGVLHAVEPAGAGRGGLPGERWTPLPTLPRRWWSPLLAGVGSLPGP